VSGAVPAGTSTSLVRVEEHRGSCVKADLHVEAPVVRLHAMLGGPLEVSTVLGEDRDRHGRGRLAARDVLRLRGDGMPQLGLEAPRRPPVTSRLWSPRLTDEQRAVIAELAAAGRRRARTRSRSELLRAAEAALGGDG